MAEAALLGVLAFSLFGVFGACHASDTASQSAAPPPPSKRTPLLDAGAYASQFHPLDSDGHVLRDERGRTVILRGYNIKVNGLFDVTPDNGQPVRETIPPLDDTDLTLMQKSGVNVLRLPVNWSAFEPQPGVFVSSYLDAITAFLDLVRPYGFYVLLDFHEDGWSKDLCEDGAPAWATVISPGQYEGGAPGGGLPCVERGSQRPFELFRPRREQSAVRGQFLVALRAPRVRRIHGDERLHWHAMGLVPLGSAPPGAATQS